MTELEIMQRAKRYMDNLANGIDPLTGQELPEDSVLNNVRLSRCFFYVSGVLGQVIDNGGTVGAKKRPHRQPFSLTAEQYARITPAEIPLTITQVVALCNAELDPEAMKPLTSTPLTAWMQENGILQTVAQGSGHNRRMPTARGHALGLTEEERMSQRGAYVAVLYDQNAQQFLIDNLPDILSWYEEARKNREREG